MEFPHSDLTWFNRLQDGEAGAAQRLWEQYFDRLVGLARVRLEGTPRRVADEEDVALSALKSFCLGAKKGRFPDIRDRDGLWRLLVVITARKAADLANYQTRKKRDAGRLQHGHEEDAMVNQVVGQEPTPEFAAMIADELQSRLDELQEDYLRQVAVLKMEGYSNEEIAAESGCSLSTVERRLRLIRRIWERSDCE